MPKEIINAVIKATHIGHDHGIPTSFVMLESDDASLGFGGYTLGKHWEFCGWWMKRILETVGVESWETLPGSYVRVEIEADKAIRIGHLMKELWFDPRVEVRGNRA